MRGGRVDVESDSFYVETQEARLDVRSCAVEASPMLFTEMFSRWPHRQKEGEPSKGYVPLHFWTSTERPRLVGLTRLKLWAARR